MPARNRLKLAHISYFSVPASDRPIYRAIRRHEVRTILEIGVGRCQRAARMIEVAKLVSPAETINYAGIDPFEARAAADGPGVSLKLGHRLLSSTGARIHLIPGDPLTALARTANELGKIDLVVISASQNQRALDGAWFYFPRLLHSGTQTFIEKTLPGGRMALQVIGIDEINARAGTYSRRRAA